MWKLCQDVATRHGSELQHCYVAFVSNPWRSVPLWRQRAGKDEDKLVVWVSWKNRAKFLYEEVAVSRFKPTAFLNVDCWGKKKCFVCCTHRTST